LVPAHTQDGFELKCFFKRNRAADGRPKANHKASGALTEMPAAEMAAAEAAHVPAAKAARVTKVSAGEMTAAELAGAEATHVADVSAYEVTATELAAAEAARVAKVSAGEMSPVPMESEAPVEAVVKTVAKAVVEAAHSDEDGAPKPVTIVVIRIGVAPTVVVAGAIVRPVIVIATVWIAGRGAGDRYGRDGIVTRAVNVAMSVSPNVVAVACVAMCDVPVQAMPV
jgi:hypothetical protein